MKRLCLFCGLCGLLLGSAGPPTPARAGEAPRPEAAAARADGATPFDAEAEAAADAVPAPTGAPPAEAPAVPPALKEEDRGSESVGGHVRAHVPDSDVPDSGVRIVISLPQQKAYVFRDGILFATSPVSTGRRGHETPAGTFRILQKKVRHRSNRYANAPMPYMQRLTWYGIALHAGRLPGYPASHGCIRLPSKFARRLYGITDFSTEVTVTHKRPKSAAAALAIA